MGERCISNGMKQKFNACLICFTFMCVNNNLVYSRFLGGTISWVPDISTNAVGIFFSYFLFYDKILTYIIKG